MGAQVLPFVLLFCSPLLAILINGEFRPCSYSALLWLLSNGTKYIHQKHFTKFFFCQDCLLLWSDPQVPDRTVCHYILRTSGLFTALYSDEKSRFQLATLAPLCEVISRADKRAARGGSKGTNYPRCLDGWQRGQQQRANLCRETHLREEDEARSQISRLQAPERFTESMAQCAASVSSLKANDGKTSEINNEVVRMRGAHKSHEDHNAAPPATRFPREESGQT